MAEPRSGEELVALLRNVARYGNFPDPVAEMMRDAADRLEACDPDARWGQRVVDVLGHEAIVRGWDRNGVWVFLEFPDSSVPAASPARDWSPA